MRVPCPRVRALLCNQELGRVRRHTAFIDYVLTFIRSRLTRAEQRQPYAVAAGARRENHCMSYAHSVYRRSG